MQSDRRRGKQSVETGAQHRVQFSLQNTTLAILLSVSLVCAAQQAVADPSPPDQQQKNRSKFEYHDGSAEEKRAYRRPDLDIDPTNLRIEELRERINALEERLERLEYQSNGYKKGR